MKWKTGFVLVLVILAVASIGVTNVIGQNITGLELLNNTYDAIDNVTSVTFDMYSPLSEIGSEASHFGGRLRLYGPELIAFETHRHVIVDYVEEKRYEVLSRPETGEPFGEVYVDGKTEYGRYRPEGGDWESWDIRDENCKWELRVEEEWYKWSLGKRVDDLRPIAPYTIVTLTLNRKNSANEPRLIDPATRLTVLGSEELNGEDCWVLKTEVQDPQVNLSKKQITIKTWISKEGYLPRKSVRVDIQRGYKEIFIPEEVPIGDIQVETTKVFYNYNKPVNIPEPPDLPTPTPTPASPGFGVAFAITGLLTVVSIIRRRRKN